MILSDGFKVPFVRVSGVHAKIRADFGKKAAEIPHRGELLGLAKLLREVANDRRQLWTQTTALLQFEGTVGITAGMDLYNFLLNTPVWMLRRMKAACLGPAFIGKPYVS